MTYNTDTYCSLAFAGFDTRAKSCCCWVRLPNQPTTFQQFLNDPDVKNLQQDLLNGVKNTLCQRCWDDESVGVESMRRSFTKHKREENILDEIQSKKIIHLVIDSGNVCNLACRTCGPDSSSSHIKEYAAKIPENRRSKPLIITKTDVDYLKTEDYSSISTIAILGGEPFQNLEHLEILEMIVDQGYAGNCSLRYTTNVTVKLSQKIKEMLSHFRAVDFTLSIDAVGQQAEYIRTNSSWADVVENVNSFKELANNNSNIQIGGHPTISALNVLYLDEVFQWHQDNNLIYRVVFCKWPPWYSFQIFNDQQKKIIIEKLESSQFDMTSIIQHIKSSIFNPLELDNFYKETKFTQEYKNLDINEYLPRLMELLRQ